MMNGQTAQEVDRVFIGSDGSLSGNSPEHVQSGNGARLPAQDQVGFSLIGKNIDFYFLDDTAQEFLSIPVRRGGRVPNPFQLTARGADLLALRVRELLALLALFAREFGFGHGSFKAEQPPVIE